MLCLILFTYIYTFIIHVFERGDMKDIPCEVSGGPLVQYKK